MKNPRISVVTVVFNGEKKIKDTMLSVLNQTYSNIEYIVLDGKSNDTTVDIIIDYNERIKNKEFNLSARNFKWLSETDNGIYDAMNKAVKISSGDWIIFMNAGDGFIDKNVISNVFADKVLLDYDVVYGNDWVELPTGYRNLHKPNKSLENLWKGAIFRHGAMFTKSDLLKNYPFKLENEYSICADFDFIYHLYFLRRSFYYIDRDILYYEKEGISSNAIRST